jgi:flagellar hook protein FlgE
MAMTSMIDHDIYLVENKGYRLMGINYHWISRMVYLISDVGNLLMRNFLPYLTSS